ncbi:MAG: hypothetical protein KME64_02675 [Scytonematopsis contorta HA4267-MV1]|jgi:hypothetical protein|nr:hypothetical protein [Scytonematopsis contorta HA4267-MV1]
MNTHTFDNHYVTCPICQKNATSKPKLATAGLFTCPYCQEKLVVIQSGNYVRDPFTLKQVIVSETIRRQSRPLARIVRDFLLVKRPWVTFALSGTIVLSLIALLGQNTSRSPQDNPQSQQVSDIDKKNK